MVKPSQGKLLYHITHLDNIPSILKHGLLSRAELQKKTTNIKFTDIANPEILSKRDLYKEALSNYVLFHFYAKNPFDCAVCRKYGSENMVIITLPRKFHEKNTFYIIPSHPLDSDKPDIYNYEDGFSRIRWDILDRETGRDYNDPEIRKACMAECVMKYTIPVEAFYSLFVLNESVKQKVEKSLGEISLRIIVSPGMFSHVNID